jgi:hypothetical protein
MACTMNLTKFCLVAATTSFIALIATKVRAIADALVPVGYEDESGFHFGRRGIVSSTSSVRLGSEERLRRKNGRALTASSNKK